MLSSYRDWTGRPTPTTSSMVWSTPVAPCVGSSCRGTFLDNNEPEGMYSSEGSRVLANAATIELLSDEWEGQSRRSGGSGRFCRGFAAVVFDPDLFACHDIAVESERGGLAHVHLHQLACQTGIALEDDDVIGHRSPGQLHGTGRAIPRLEEVLARPLDQHLDCISDALAVMGEAHGVLNGQEIVVAALLRLLGHIIGIQFVRLRSRARTVLEDETVLEAGLADQIAGSLELLLRFATEADDEIAGDGNARHPLAAACKHLPIISYCVEPFHPL